MGGLECCECVRFPRENGHCTRYLCPELSPIFGPLSIWNFRPNAEVTDLGLRYAQAEGQEKEELSLELLHCFHSYLMKYVDMILRGHLPRYGGRVNEDAKKLLNQSDGPGYGGQPGFSDACLPASSSGLQGVRFSGDLQRTGDCVAEGDQQVSAPFSLRRGGERVEIVRRCLRHFIEL
jgi:hypothetical protein